MQNVIWTWDKTFFKKCTEILVRQRWYPCGNLYLSSADCLLDSMPAFYINISLNSYTIMVKFYHHENLHMMNLRVTERIGIQINLILKHILFLLLWLKDHGSVLTLTFLVFRHLCLQGWPTPSINLVILPSIFFIPNSVFSDIVEHKTLSILTTIIFNTL